MTAVTEAAEASEASDAAQTAEAATIAEAAQTAEAAHTAQTAQTAEAAIAESAEAAESSKAAAETAEAAEATVANAMPDAMMDSCHGDGFRDEPVVGSVVAGAGHGDQTEQKKHSSDLHVDLRRRKVPWMVNSRARGDGVRREGKGGIEGNGAGSIASWYEKERRARGESVERGWGGGGKWTEKG